jgi:hypothetical protein
MTTILTTTMMKMTMTRLTTLNTTKRTGIHHVGQPISMTTTQRQRQARNIVAKD